MDEISKLRRDYSLMALNEGDVKSDPLNQFSIWFNEAVKAQINEPNAMHLATITVDGRPSGRMVLLKGLQPEGFTFYTNYQSNKGKELDHQPACCLTFFWPELERQIRIEGVTERLSEQVAEQYFQSRPRGSQIGAWASPQSAVIKNRKILEDRMHDLATKFGDTNPIQKPRQWGGYLVRPFLIEFWQGRSNRLHDRIRYLLAGDKWEIRRLAP
ncbi:MAG: pyridoxamine 5'-phosphate oxidase [Cyclobacteriaceae bacterium]